MAPLRRSGETLPIIIEAGAAYEMVMSLVTFTETGNHAVAEVGPEWLADVERRAGPSLTKRLAEFSQGTGDGFVHLLPMVYDAAAPRDPSAFIEHVAETDADELVRTLLGYQDYHNRRMTPPEVMDAAVQGDDEAISAVVAACEGWPEWHPFVERLLKLGSRRAKAELVDLLRDWHARVWSAIEAEIAPILERDADAKRQLARELPFDRFVEMATNGVQYVSRPGIERLVLIPSYANRPWVSFAEWHGAAIMIYPVADESVAADSDAPPLRLIRLTKALADEKRLRILRALADRPRTLMELSEQFEMPKTSMHHHMVTLRSAGLVTVASGTKDKEYRLRNDVLPGMATMLAGYIATSAKPAAGAAPDPEPARATARGAHAQEARPQRESWTRVRSRPAR
jgi:DNA-binding transcriptional ArsR family regulator